MLKCDEVRMPESCFSKARDNERLFVLLARDITAPWVVRFWCLLRILTRKNKLRDMQIREAWRCAKLMKRERDAKKAA